MSEKSDETFRILHTADWHLGQHFHNKDRFEEHQLFLDFLIETIQREKIDLLLVAGDVFDTANPPRESERMYFDFLLKIVKKNLCKTVIVGGNHDSAPHLDAPRRLLSALDIHIVGALPENMDEYMFEFVKGKNKVLLAAIPYLRDKDVRKAVASESFDDIEKRTKTGIFQCYETAAACLAQKSNQDTINIATGHLTVVGGRVSEHERSIHIGNLGSIKAEQFPNVFDYIALGHLHHPQAVGELEHIRYSGSPIPLSFGEAARAKEIRLLEIQENQIHHRPVEIPVFRKLIRIKGNSDQIRQTLKSFKDSSVGLTPWAEVKLTETEYTSDLNDEIRTVASKRGLEVLKVEVERQASTMEQNDFENLQIDDLSPDQVFEKRLEHYEGDVDSQTLMQCFQSVTNRMHEEDAR